MNETTVGTDIFHSSIPRFDRPVRMGLPGRKIDIEGAPLARWGIAQRDLPESERLDHVWPEGETGQAMIFMGDFLLDNAARRIIHRPRDPYDFFNVNRMLELVRERRDSGVINPATGHSTLFINMDVSRCSTPGCELFGGWHLGRSPKHVKLDLSTEAYHCRLIMVSGTWTPEISWIKRTPSAEQVASYVSDAHWILTEMSKAGLTPPSLAHVY